MGHNIIVEIFRSAYFSFEKGRRKYMGKHKSLFSKTSGSAFSGSGGYVYGADDGHGKRKEKRTKNRREAEKSRKDSYV